MATRSADEPIDPIALGQTSPATLKKAPTMLSKLAVALVAVAVFTVPALAQTPAPNGAKASASQSAPTSKPATVVKADAAPAKHMRHARHFHGTRLVGHVTHVKYVHRAQHMKYAHNIKRVKFAHHIKPATTQNAKATAPSGLAPAKSTIRSAAKSGAN
jgi:hypothetical protein